MVEPNTHSLIFLVTAVLDSQRIPLVAGMYLVAGWAYYARRQSCLQRDDVQVEAVNREEVEAASKREAGLMKMPDGNLA